MKNRHEPHMSFGVFFSFHLDSFGVSTLVISISLAFGAKPCVTVLPRNKIHHPQKYIVVYRTLRLSNRSQFAFPHVKVSQESASHANYFESISHGHHAYKEATKEGEKENSKDLLLVRVEYIYHLWCA